MSLFQALLVPLLSTAFLLACDEELPGSPAGPAHDLAATRVLARADVDRALAEQLAAEQLLRVDAGVPRDADQTRHLLLAGELDEAPASLDALRADLGDRVLREVLLGGEDASRPVLFREVAEGTYTVCVASSPPKDAETEAVVARATAIVEADPPMTGEKLEAALAAAQAEVGHRPRRIDWDTRPVRCRRVSVDARPDSRIVAFAPA